MKLILLLMLCAAPFQMMEDVSTWVVKTPRRMFELSSERWAIDDSILSVPITGYMPINEQRDTIYVLDGMRDNRPHLHWINVWKNNNPKVVKYTDSTVSSYDKSQSYSKESGVYHSLIRSWETDLLRHIGNEAQRNIIPTLEQYLVRIIFENGATRVDTVSFYDLGDIEKFTHHQLDSLREVIRQKKQMEKDSMDGTYSDNVVSLPDSIPPSTNANDAIATKEEPTRSLWQRIVDWFLGLWKAIFG
ncbi:MAG: hypothetical protein K2K65_08535 [Duncaniella sp.]|nr:hypothetical protein [Duncaniella sp.]